MSVMSEEREGSSAGRPMSTAEVPSSDEKKTHVFDCSKVACDGAQWRGEAWHCFGSAPGEISSGRTPTIVLGLFCERSGW